MLGGGVFFETQCILWRSFWKLCAATTFGFCYIAVLYSSLVEVSEKHFDIVAMVYLPASQLAISIRALCTLYFSFFQITDTGRTSAIIIVYVIIGTGIAASRVLQ